MYALTEHTVSKKKKKGKTIETQKCDSLLVSRDFSFIVFYLLCLWLLGHLDGKQAS